MDDQPTVPTAAESASAASEITPKKSHKKKTLLGFGGVLIVLVVAGATYGILDMTKPQLAREAKPAPVVEKVDSPELIDSKVQSDIESEQKLEDQISEAESQTVIDDINATQELEANYANL